MGTFISVLSWRDWPAVIGCGIILVAYELGKARGRKDQTSFKFSPIAQKPISIMELKSNKTCSRIILAK